MRMRGTLARVRRTAHTLATLLAFGALPIFGQGRTSVEAWPQTWTAGRAGVSAEARARSTAQELAKEEGDGLTFLGTAKWASLAVATGAAVYGFSLNSQADGIFEQLDDICLLEPERCELRNPDDSFRDESLESLYQRTLEKDRLIVSQVTLAAAVLFFVMDLSNRSPPNIPYDPPAALSVGPTPSGGYTLGVRIHVGL
jgi:hypothetical protein